MFGRAMPNVRGEKTRETAGMAGYRNAISHPASGAKAGDQQEGYRGIRSATRFSSLLKANGEDVKVVQELLRHSTSRMTLDTYTQVRSPQRVHDESYHAD